MTLLNNDFLLNTDIAKRLFHEYAENQPIVDYHCHLEPKEIYENKNYDNISQIWINEGLYGDHYKWRLERDHGVPEELITGDGDDYDKFVAWAKTIDDSLGSPLYEWSHLELRRFFGINKRLDASTAPEIWKETNQQLQTPAFTPRALIARSNVQVVVTTDSPESDLKYHELLAKEKLAFKVLPGMRPDDAFNINDEGYRNYMLKLGEAANIQINSFKALSDAMAQRVTFFAEHGGKIADLGLNSFYYAPASVDELETIFTKGMNNESLTTDEINKYTTALVEVMMKLAQEHDWVLQYHVNVARSQNKPMFDKIGANTGFDSVGTQADLTEQIRRLFYDAQAKQILPKTIFYSLNPNDWMAIATLLGNFQEGTVQKMHLGAGWWFNDTRDGMEKQMKLYANVGMFPNFLGMLTDSRSFLSYPRHEYFRRVLCEVIGQWVANGQAPDDLDYLGRVVKRISYENARDYFGFFDE
ncbi:glucuronate isomerase [Lactiplantibacillus pentosus KCA1]|nr:glucuronate isomerase [Lactiplantibacillus pentosus]EIW12516.1 glucuronate isomerase [Lactiplantibacillus pentosus KCA1]